MRDAVHNVADKGQVAKAVKNDKRRAINEINNLKALLGTRYGRNVLWSYISYCRVFQSCFVSNALEMAHLEGVRDVGVKMIADIERADEKALMLMMKEAKDGE